MARKAKIRLCCLCRERPAAVPDRERWPPRSTLEVCGECHVARLRGDLQRILAARRPPPDPEVTP